MSARTFGKHVVAPVATAAFCIALVGPAASNADAAPYPPSEPCWVTANARGDAAQDGTNSYDVVGSGLGSAQPVRVVLAETGRQVGTAQTDVNGNFRTVVTAPRDADASAPDFTASSPQQTCTGTPPPTSSPTSPPPTGPTTSVPSRSPGTPPAGGSGRPGGTGGVGAPGGTPGSGPAAGGSSGAGVQPGSGTGPGAGASASGTPSGGGTTAPGGADGSSSGTAAPSSSRSSIPPVADPLPGTDTPFGIGLGIAAVLLVLGTLAVLLLTRRPER